MSSEFHNTDLKVDGSVYQAGNNNYLGSTHVQGNGPVIVNNIRLERRWTRPTPPPLLREVIRREHALEAVSSLLRERGQLALSGRTTASAAVRGLPGIGKTTLARLLALELAPRYEDGVLWEELGPDFRSADRAQPILDRWASLALAIPPGAGSSVHFEPGAVRALLSEHPRLLVVLDNVWSLEALRPLREALPPQAHLLVTTRSGVVARGFGGTPYELHELTPQEARELMALRLNLKDMAPHAEWCDKLAAGLGFHTLALDVALGRLLYEGDTPADWRASAERIVEYVRAGEGFDGLHLEEEEEEERSVELVLSYSYRRMGEVAQSRFRLLGAMAPDADFDTGAVAQLWEYEPQQAKGQLDAFVNAALLGRKGRGRWAQHGVLRGYALALLRRAGEYEKAAANHAQIYGEAMRAAHDAQRFALMRPELPQLHHAFEWSVQNDLWQTLILISNCSNLHAAFGLVRKHQEWCEAALAVARQRGDPAAIANAQLSLGNSLQRVVGLPGQSRANRLQQALEAYEEALRHYTPEAAPLAYAGTQNNRALLLSDLATLPGEARAERLHQALEAYGEALRYHTPEAAPLDYAKTQHNRALLLRDLATLPGEARAERLHQALEASEEALRYRTPEAAPLDYAGTQNNRANLLSALATLPGEERAERLHQALEAYEEALRYHTPEAAPLDYAMTQYNRANLLSDLATLPGEARAERLHQALEAYEEALRYRTPKAAPLDYAETLCNLSILLLLIASLPGENSSKRLVEALQSAWIALTFFTNLQHQKNQEIATQQLLRLRVVLGDDFDTLWQQVHNGPPPPWLTEEDGNKTVIRQVIDAIIAAPDPRALAQLWQQAPVETGSALLDAIEERITVVSGEERAHLEIALRDKLKILRELQSGAAGGSANADEREDE